MVKLSDLDKKLYACLQCGYCRASCPVYDQIGWESATPRGKVYFLKEISRNGPLDRLFGRKAELNPKFTERMWQCTSCAACEEECHAGIHFADLWEQVKERMVKEGWGPLDAHRTIFERIATPSKRNPFHDDKDPNKDLISKRGAWLPQDVKLSPDPDVMFFAGCTESYRRQDLAQASVRLLAKAGVKFSILGPDEWCCGSPLLRTGQTELVKKELIQHNVNEMEKRGVPVLLTACAGCYNTIKRDYPKVFGKLPFKLYHISEFLEKLIKEKKLVLSKPVSKSVTYHDPCHLGRHAKVFVAPRNVIKAIPGIKYVEMERNKMKSRCCGAGGGFKAQFNDMAESIAVERIREAKEAGAELIVTTCPFCGVNLNAGAKKAGIDLKTVDLVQLVSQAV